MRALVPIIIACAAVGLGCAGTSDVRSEGAEAESRFREAVARARQGEVAQTLSAIDSALRAGGCPTLFLTESAFADVRGEPRFRDLIRAYTRQPSAVMVASSEPGTPLLVRGRVCNAAGDPVAAALVYAYHTDARGYYSAQGMDETTPRLFAYVRTDVRGEFQLRTVRPGHYPDAGDEPVEQHIHFEVTAEGFRSRLWRLGFADDPFWIAQGRTPPRWAVPVRSADGVQHCDTEIALERLDRIGRSIGDADSESHFQDARHAAGEGEVEPALDSIARALQAGSCPTRVLTEAAFANLHVEARFHHLIRGHALQSSTVLVTPGEPGTPMVVSGVVRDGAGAPVVGALVHVFHADTKGEYTPTKPMDEPHSRIFGYMRTDAEGRYQFRTIRPGGYQNPVQLDGQARLIPEHVHFEIEAEGFEDNAFQLVFDDDPRMDQHWRTQWAPSLKAPIVKPTRDSTGVQRCNHDIALHRRPPGAG